MRRKIALITGICGQDGSFLAEYLLGIGYEVHGIIRRCSSFNTGRIDHIFDKLKLHYGDLLDSQSIASVITEICPDEIYHLGAMSHVKVSFEMPQFTLETCVTGTLNVLEAVRTAKLKHTRIYNASSSEMFGASPGPQNENTPFLPQSPYACGKVCAHQLCRNYRESYGMFISNGILFNHESERRGETFVTRKISKAIAGILAGTQHTLALGNLDSVRDWGYAGEYVVAMHALLQHEFPEDVVIATGVATTVREFVGYAFEHVNLDWRDYVVVDPKYYRPSEVNYLCGDTTKAKQLIGWNPKIQAKHLAEMMVDYDLSKANIPISRKS